MLCWTCFFLHWLHAVSEIVTTFVYNEAKLLAGGGRLYHSAVMHILATFFFPFLFHDTPLLMLLVFAEVFVVIRLSLFLWRIILLHYHFICHFYLAIVKLLKYGWRENKGSWWVFLCLILTLALTLNFWTLNMLTLCHSNLCKTYHRLIFTYLCQVLKECACWGMWLLGLHNR